MSALWALPASAIRPSTSASLPRKHGQFISWHSAATGSSAAFVVVATTTSSVYLLLLCRSIICAMTGFPASGISIFPGRREDVMRPSMVATTLLPLIAIKRDSLSQYFRLFFRPAPIPIVILECDYLLLHFFGDRAEARCI